MSQFKRVFSAFLCGETVSLWGLQIIADHSYFSVFSEIMMDETQGVSINESASYTH